MLTLNLDLQEKSYPIFIGENLLNQDLLSSYIFGKQVLIVSNTTVAPLYLKTVKSQLQGLEVRECILSDGEEYKTLKTLNLIYTELLNNRFDRSCTLIALGGGVVGDITGFAASSYQRGVNFVQIPTTLLSQVDSSVGGKTGVNHAIGKNMIGAFYQPKAVIIDINTLKTLEDRQFSAGMAEVIKYGLLGDKKFYAFITNNIKSIMESDTQILAQVIYTSCQNKASIVAKDEFEKDVRALLNLGHTFGHGIENTLGYGKMLHGEAVAVGILMAAEFSYLEGYISNSEVLDIHALLEKCNLPTRIADIISPHKFYQAMSVDKKALAGNMRFVLLKKIGHAFIAHNYNVKHLEKIIKKFCNT